VGFACPCTSFTLEHSRDAPRVLKGSLRRGEGRGEVPLGRLLEAMLTLDLALSSDVQGDGDTFPGWGHS
jgi:hypothetical protein